VLNGARTFLSAAIPEGKQGFDLLPTSAKHIAADRNVRAPAWTDTFAESAALALYYWQ